MKIKNKRLYNIWSCMKQRCNNSNNPAAFWYHDKGIKVCDEWLNYSKFELWALENGYEDNLTIDRIDSDGNYEPNNCQWITKNENSRKASIGRRNSSKRHKRYKTGRFMVVRIKERISFCNPIVKIVKTGLTKCEAVSLAKTLESSEENKCFKYYDRVTDGNKEGDFVFWDDLRQYISKNKTEVI